jgi:hypothetical protein
MDKTTKARASIRDIDLLAVSDEPAAVMERFVHLPVVAHVYDKGDTKPVRPRCLCECGSRQGQWPAVVFRTLNAYVSIERGTGKDG